MDCFELCLKIGDKIQNYSQRKLNIIYYKCFKKNSEEGYKIIERWVYNDMNNMNERRKGVIVKLAKYLNMIGDENGKKL